MTRRQPTLIDLTVRNLRASGLAPVPAYWKASQVVATIWRLATAAERLGYMPEQQRYAEYWGSSPRSAQRDWSRFREAFPDERSPERLARWVLREGRKRLGEGPNAAAQVAEPPADLQLLLI